MKRVLALCAVLAGLICAALLPARGAGVAELTLLDAPRGAWLATVRADARMTVVEVGEGWRRVRIEGWVAGSAAPDAGAAGPAASREEGAGAVVRGVLLPGASDPSPAPGAGLLVVLASDLAAMDAEHAAAGRECKARLDATMAGLARARDLYAKALNSTDNFREATERNDRLKAEIAAAEKLRKEQIAACRRSADTVMQRHAAKRAISDELGRFEFTGVAAGRYRVIATESAGDPPRAWALDCTVAGPGETVLDPRQHGSAFEPYWGLR